jgi:hypothetical protein
MCKLFTSCRSDVLLAFYTIPIFTIFCFKHPCLFVMAYIHCFCIVLQPNCETCFCTTSHASNFLKNCICFTCSFFPEQNAQSCSPRKNNVATFWAYVIITFFMQGPCLFDHISSIRRHGYYKFQHGVGAAFVWGQCLFEGGFNFPIFPLIFIFQAKSAKVESWGLEVFFVRNCPVGRPSSSGQSGSRRFGLWGLAAAIWSYYLL